jgi:hypothetical protein
LDSSVCVSRQAFEQKANPGGHTQRPLTQLWPTGHARPQPPQWALSDVVARSQPLAAFMSQSAKPCAHVPRRHVPAAHDAAAFGNMHGLPHAPQWDALV